MNGERIKLARKRSGLSLRDLAHKMDDTVTAQAIGKYERDEMTPSSEVLISLTQALDVSLAYLMAPHAIELGEVEFQTKANNSARDRTKVEAAVLESVERYLNTEEAEDLANTLRDEWDLGLDPLPNMTELVGGKGHQGPHRGPP